MVGEHQRGLADEKEDTSVIDGRDRESSTSKGSGMSSHDSSDESSSLASEFEPPETRNHQTANILKSSAMENEVRPSNDGNSKPADRKASNNDLDGNRSDHKVQSDRPISQIRSARKARDIHILGYGNVGQFIGHSLAGIPDRPRVTFLFARASILGRWLQAGQTLSLERQGMTETRDGFRGQLIMEPSTGSALDHEPIANLIVAVKAQNTVAALRSVAHRLLPSSTVFFLQNGMGSIDEVNRDIFPDPRFRPSYTFGIVSHALQAMDRFKIRHNHVGTIAMSALPPTRDTEFDPQQESLSHLNPSSLYLLRTFTRTPVLGAVGVRPFEFRLLQLEKLAMNCIINPLSVIYECSNGEILYNVDITRVIRLLLAEISLVIRSLPEMQAVPNLQARFSPAELEYKVFALATNTASNDSSMLQDFRNKGNTELNYLNGYIVRRGEELGIKCVMNFLLIQMVNGKIRMAGNRSQGLVPVLEHDPEAKSLVVEGEREVDYLAMREAAER